ncbi:NAD(P)H dehydrogenase (quinone) [Gluconobacter cerinus]|uniref:NAD(P)H dehydrogenase (Quinone) n=1 Tax=Gluconobacter cerinus TaxID=38307 RepID=A0A1B6VHI3_9PROT|nr:NAD(P)H dehydrogenase (quinone) [Gluconobacter cerinus]
MLDVAVSELHALGHQVQVSDLYAMNWKTTVDCDDFPGLKTTDRLKVAAVAISSKRPIVPRGIKDSNICLASGVST